MTKDKSYAKYYLLFFLKRPHEETKTRWSTREILSFISPIQMCYK